MSSSTGSSGATDPDDKKDDDKEKDEKPPQSAVSIISDTIKSVADAFTATFIGASEAVSGAATSIITGTKSVVSDVADSITSSVASIAQGVSALTASLGPVGAVIGGVVSAVSAVTGAVVGIATTVINTVLSIGSAVLTTATAIVTTALSLVGSVISTISSVVSTIGTVMAGATAALSALGPIAAAIGAALAGVASIIGSVVGALTSVVTGIVSAVTSVVSAITSAFKAVSESFSQLAGIAGEALGGLVSAVNSCIESLLSFANNVTSISNNTGMSTSQASSLVSDLQVLGVSGKEANQMFASQSMMPERFNGRANVTGLPQMGSANFLADTAKTFQDMKAKDGLPFATARLQAQFGPQFSQQILRVSSTDPKKLQANLNYNHQVQGQLGISDGQIKSASEDLPLLMARVSSFIDTVKVKFAAELLPSLEAAFSVVSNILLGNAGNISNLLQSVTRTIFVDGPDIAANAALTVIGWASTLADMFFNLVDAGISLMEAFGKRDGALYGILLVGARFVDFVSDVSGKVSGAIAFMQAAFEGGIHYLLTSMISALMGPLSLIPGAVDKAEDVFSQFIGFKFEATDPYQAYNDEVNKHTRFSAVDALNNQSDSWDSRRIKGMRDTNDANRTRTHGLSNGAIASVHDLRDHFSSQQQLNQNYNASLLQVNQRSLAIQESQLAVSQQQLDVAKSGQGSGGTSGQIIARMSAYLAEDAYRLTSR